MSDETDEFMAPSDVAEVDAEADVPVGGEVPGAAEDSGSRSLLSPLMSTEPDVSPREVKGALDTSVPWHKHLQVGVMKATGASGMPTFVHLILAGALFVKQDGDVSLSSIRGGGNDDGGNADPGPDPDVITGDDL